MLICMRSGVVRVTDARILNIRLAEYDEQSMITTINLFPISHLQVNTNIIHENKKMQIQLIKTEKNSFLVTLYLY